MTCSTLFFWMLKLVIYVGLICLICSSIFPGRPGLKVDRRYENGTFVNYAYNIFYSYKDDQKTG